MATKAKMCCEGICGMHLCGKCAMPMAVFGLLFMIVGFNLWNGAPGWFNGWSILGVFMALWGVMAILMKK